MADRGRGTIVFTGATASLRGGAEFHNLAVPKFDLRALAQSMARELGPKGVHVARVIVDGQIMSEAHDPASRHAGRLPGPGGHRRQLPDGPPPAPQRLDLGGRAPPLGRDILVGRDNPGAGAKLGAVPTFGASILI